MQVSSSAVASNEPFVEELHQELDHLRSHRATGGDTQIDGVGVVELREVGFSYGGGRPALIGLSARIPSGEAIGIVGPSGSGKSTLAQLLLGVLEPQHGEILIDGVPLSEVPRSIWCRRATFVPQTPHLIPGTIADNIRFFRDVPRKAIELAARRAHVHEEIVAMEHGYDRSLAHGGALSGGQQQRVCIARALLEDPDVIVLDEPTSALDVRSEHLIGETLAELRATKTVIIIAHRLSTLRGCDRLMVVQGGQLVGFDTPEQLERTNEFYGEVLRLSGLATE
jgi:ABC-type multidrug transport system fused ATPase/permease subunit